MQNISQISAVVPEKRSSEGFLSNMGMAAIFVVVALLFYVHGKHLRSCRDGQLT